MDNEKRFTPENADEINASRLVDQIAGNFSAGETIELHAHVRGVTDWTDENAPQGRSTEPEGNIEFRKEGESEWDGYLATSDKAEEVKAELQVVADRLRAKGFKVNVIEE